MVFSHNRQLQRENKYYLKAFLKRIHIQFCKNKLLNFLECFKQKLYGYVHITFFSDYVILIEFYFKTYNVH